jgi:metal-responsive CopG/Arc/MetJ family transcriptional regulator
MRVVVSIPDGLFKAADRLAQRMGTSRSALYARALSSYVQANAPEQVAAALDDFVATIGEENDPFLRAAAARRFDSTDW